MNARYHLAGAIVSALAMGSMIVSGIAIAGYLFNAPVLIHWREGWASMAFPTAVCLFGNALALLILANRHHDT